MDIILKIILLVLLIFISYKDYKCRTIPNELIMLIIILGTLHQLFSLGLGDAYEIHMDSLLGFLISGLIGFTIAFITQGLGGGDIKLMGALGFWIGLKNIYVFLSYMSITGAIFILFLKFIKKEKIINSIPLAPFITLSTFITMIK